MRTARELQLLGKELSIERASTENIEAIVELLTIELEERRQSSGGAVLKSRNSGTLRFNQQTTRDVEVKFI